jgi:hypothetical protein
VDASYSGTYVFIGGGADGNGAAGTATKVVEAGQIAAGGDLGALVAVKTLNLARAGYGVCAANGQLFVMGGKGAAPSADEEASQLTTPAPGLANWNAQGSFSLTHGRYLMGSTVQSAFIFLLGGQTDEPSPASKTIDVGIW